MPPSDDQSPPPTPVNPVKHHSQTVFAETDAVTIDDTRLHDLAAELADQELAIPTWDQPVFPTSDTYSDADIVDFFVIGNALNFCFNNLETGEKFAATYRGTEWAGAFGMWACLKKALDTGIDILDPATLAHLDTGDVADLFAPSNGVELPLLDARRAHLNELGDLLQTTYDGTFHTLFTTTSRIYTPAGNDEPALVSSLTDLDAYRDEWSYRGHRVRFDKRAQLAVSMIYGRYQDADWLTLTDLETLSLFADYGIPAYLRSYGVLTYENSTLRRRVDTHRPLPAGSRHEIAIRAATVVAGERLRTRLATEYEQSVSIPQLDYALWSLRNDAETNAHLTKTTAY